MRVIKLKPSGSYYIRYIANLLGARFILYGMHSWSNQPTPSSPISRLLAVYLYYCRLFQNANVADRMVWRLPLPLRQ